MTPPWRTATDMLARLRAGGISSLELLEQHIERVQQLDPAINAVVVRDFDTARQRARSARDSRASQAVKGRSCVRGQHPGVDAPAGLELEPLARLLELLAGLGELLHLAPDGDMLGGGDEAAGIVGAQRIDGFGVADADAAIF